MPYTLLGLVRPGIRRRLFLLALSLTLPVAIISLARAFERWQSETAELTARSQASVSNAAQLIDSDLNSARTALDAASKIVRFDSPVSSNDSLLGAIFDPNVFSFANVLVADTGGKVHATLRTLVARPTDTNIALSGVFLDALKGKRFVVGKMQRSGVLPDSAWVLPITVPVTNNDRSRVVGVAAVSLPVDSMAATRLLKTLPAGSVLSIISADHTLLLRTLVPDDWLRRPHNDEEIRALAEIPLDTAVVMSFRDGARRFIARAPLASIDGSVVLGVPTSQTLQVVQRQLYLDLIIGAFGTLLFVGFALYTAQRISAPILSLVAVARRLTAGDRSARSLIKTTDEIGELALSLNQLADTVLDRESDLAASEERYRRLFATSPLPLITWHPQDGLIDQANDSAQLFFGADQLRDGARIIDLIVDEEHDEFSSLPMPYAAQTIHAGLWTVRNVNAERRRVELFVGSLEQQNRVVAIAVLVDVSDRLRAERELEQSREQLRQAQKLDALGSFAGGIAHDFNNYLSAISTNAELLVDQLAHDSSLQEEAQDILGAARRASTLTRQILVFSRRSTVHDERIDVNAHLLQLKTMLSRMIGEGVEVSVVCGEGVPDILLDEGRLEQIMMNLTANARDAMLGGGRLVITTRRSDSGDLELSVTDNGEGISDSNMSRVFEPFFTTKPRERGTGLGLSIVYSIVTNARGTIDIRSGPDSGTSVVIVLPGLQDEAPVKPMVTAAEVPATGNEHILVVEDNEAVRQSTTRFLLKAGYRVSCAEGAEEAYRLLASLDSPPDLVLSDVVMPRISGPQMIEKIRMTYPGMAVLFMSGYADDDIVTRGISSNSLKFVAKPFTSQELLRAVRESLDLKYASPQAMP